MPEKEIRPSSGEVWRVWLSDGNPAVCFIYEDIGPDGKKSLYKAWMGGTWEPGPVSHDMVNGKNNWKRVYIP